MCSILILDDEKVITDIMVDWLDTIGIANNGHTVIVANTIKEAKKQISQFRYNHFPMVMFVDVNLGKGETGLDFVEWTRKRHLDAIVYIITGSNIMEYKKQFIDLGIAGIFKKPIDFNLLEITLLSELNRFQPERTTVRVSPKDQKLLEVNSRRQKRLLKKFEDFNESFRLELIERGVIA